MEDTTVTSSTKESTNITNESDTSGFASDLNKKEGNAVLTSASNVNDSVRSSLKRKTDDEEDK